MILTNNKQNYRIISTKILKITPKLKYNIDQKTGNYFKKSIKRGKNYLKIHCNINQKKRQNYIISQVN